MKTELLKKGWFHSDIEGIRKYDETKPVELFKLENLPYILKELDDEYSWLSPFPKISPNKNKFYYENFDNIEVDDSNFDLKDELNILKKEADSKALKIPKEFFTFMENPQLLKCIRSNTNCYFTIGDFIEEYPEGSGLYFVRFINDSQYSAFWYLCLQKNGEYAVVASFNLYGQKGDMQGYRSEEYEIGYISSYSFKEFIYRFWIENNIWIKKVFYEVELTEEEKEYMWQYILIN